MIDFGNFRPEGGLMKNDRIGRVSTSVTLRVLGRIENEVGTEVARAMPPFALACLASLWEHHQGTWIHSLSLCRRAFITGQILGLAKDQIVLLATSGLIHDVGKLDIDVAILDSPEALSESELAIIRKHPTTMFTLLGAVMPEAAKIAVQHHEFGKGKFCYPRSDMISGVFPKGAFEKPVSAVDLRVEVPWMSRQLGEILSMLDFVDALSEPRAYKNAQPPEFVLGEVLKIYGKDMHEIAKGAIGIKLAYAP